MRLCRVVLVLAPLIIAHPTARAQGIRTERPPPFDFSSGCATVSLPESPPPVSLCDDEVPAVAALAFADHASGLVSARGAVVNRCPPCDYERLDGVQSDARVGIGLVLPRGSTADLEAFVDATDAVRAEVCLVAGFFESCARPAPGERLKLALRVQAPPDATLVADPSVVLHAPERTASTPAEAYARVGAGSALVRLFAYTIS